MSEVRDPIASLRPCAVDVQVGGEWYLVPALPAVDWMAAIIGEPGGIIPGLLDDDDRYDITQRVVSGQLDIEDINEAWRNALAAACGRSWWSAARLVQSAAAPEAWAAVHGNLFAQGVDLERVSIGALCNALYFMLISGAKDEQELSTAKFQLELPPPGEAKKAFADRREIGNDFMATMSQLQGLG